jgi:hypothetical protein
MSTTAVTPTASAAVTTPSKSERHAEFLPSGNEYRMTGKMPAESGDNASDESQSSNKETAEKKSSQEVTPKTDASAASSDAEKAAASETASSQKKTADTPASENRWQKLSRENKELRERITKLETGSPTRETTASQTVTPEAKPAAAAASVPKATPKPKIDDVDPATKQPKYKTFEEYETAKDAWTLDEAVRKVEEKGAKTQREQQIAQSKQVVATEFGKRVEAARTKYNDFDEVALHKDLPIKEGSAVDFFTLDSPIGTDVLYFLGKNPTELARINKLNNVGAIRELTKIELKLTPADAAKPAAAADAAKTSAKPVTQAPAPAHQVSGNGAVAKDTAAQAVEDGDSDTYIRAENAKALARRKKG